MAVAYHGEEVGNSMGRFYVLSRKLLPEQVEKVSEIMSQVEGMNSFEFAGDGSGVTVFADEALFGKVMDKAVNVFSQQGGGATLSFDHFVYADGE